MAKRPRIPRPVPVKEIILDVLSPGERDALELRHTIRRVWEAVVPAPLLRHTRLVELRRKELWIEVDASAWGQELQFLKPRILEALARTLGPEKILDLRLQVGGKSDSHPA